MVDLFREIRCRRVLGKAAVQGVLTTRPTALRRRQVIVDLIVMIPAATIPHVTLMPSQMPVRHFTDRHTRGIIPRLRHPIECPLRLRRRISPLLRDGKRQFPDSLFSVTKDLAERLALRYSLCI